jgi:hypothetical protein
MVYDIDYRMGPEYISPIWEGQIPSRYMQPNKYFSITRETPLWSPFHNVMFDDLKSLFRYQGVVLSHGLRNMIQT